MALDWLFGAALGTFVAANMILAMLLFAGIYIFTALALMVIAKKTKTENAWLAWIPVANLYLMTKIAGVSWWTLLIVLFGNFIPILGGIAALAVMIWWWWKIAEARNKPGWYGILMLIPIVNLIVMAILAWAD